MTNLEIHLDLDDGDVPAKLERAAVSVERFASKANATSSSLIKMQESTKSLGLTFRDLAVSVNQGIHAIEGLYDFATGGIKKIIEVNAQFEKMVAVMRSLSTAADPLADATKQVQELRDMAKEAPFSLNAMHIAMTRITAAGLDTKSTMEGLVDAVAAFGGTDAELERASLAFQEMAGKGVVQMKELRNQLMMAVPSAGRLIGQAFGESYGQVMADIHTGTVDAKSMIAGLTLEFERAFGGDAQRQMQTFNGLIGRTAVLAQNIAIKDVGKPLNDQTGEYNANGFMGAVKKQISDFNEVLDSHSGHVFGQELGEDLTQMVHALRTVVDYGIKFKDEIGGAAKLFAEGFAIKLAFSGIAAVAGAFVGLGKYLSSITTRFTELAPAMRAARAAIEQGGPSGASRMVEEMKQRAKAASDEVKIAKDRQHNLEILAQQAKGNTKPAAAGVRTAAEQGRLDAAKIAAQNKLNALLLEQQKIEAASWNDAIDRVEDKKTLAAHARDKALDYQTDPNIEHDQVRQAKLNEDAAVAEQRVLDQKAAARKIAMDQSRQMDEEIAAQRIKTRELEDAASSPAPNIARSEAEQAQAELNALAAEDRARQNSVKIAVLTNEEKLASDKVTAAEEEAIQAGKGTAWLSAKSIFPVILSGLGGVAMAAPIAAMAIGLLADQFDLFGTKAEQAYDDMVKFGAESEKMAKDTSEAQIANLNKKIEAERKAQSLSGVPMMVDGYEAPMGSGDPGELQRLIDLRNEAMKNAPGQIAGGRLQDSQAYAKQQMAGLEPGDMKNQLAYNTASRDAMTAFTDKVKDLNAQHRSSLAVTLDYQDAQKARALAFYDVQIKAANDLIEAQKELLMLSSTDGDKDKHAAAIDAAEAKKAKYEEDRKKEEEQHMGLQKNAKPLNDEKLIENYSTEMQKLEANIESYKAGIGGADQEAEKLYETWRLIGKAGDGDLERTQAMLIAMKQRVELADDYRKIMQSGGKLEKDYQDIIDKDNERAFKAQYGKLSEVEQLRKRRELGEFSGWGGSDQESQRLIALRKAAQDFTDALPGDQAAGHMGRIADSLDRVGASFGKATNALVNAMNGPTPIGTGAAGGNGSVMYKGPDGDFYDRMGYAESGNDMQNGLLHGNHGGKYQFEPNTWKSVMSNHPELGLTAGGFADEDQARKGIHALGSDNDTALAKVGIELSNTNRYMAMFMGSGGATSFMRAMAADPSQSFAAKFGKEADANASIAWADKARQQPRSLQQVYDMMSAKIGDNRPDLMPRTWVSQGQKIDGKGGSDDKAAAAEANAKVQEAKEQYRLLLAKLGKKETAADLEAGGMSKHEAETNEFIKERAQPGNIALTKDEAAKAIAAAQALDKAEAARKDLSEKTTAATSAEKISREKIASMTADQANMMKRILGQGGAVSDNVQKEIDAATQRFEQVKAAHTAGTPEDKKAISEAQERFSSEVSGAKSIGGLTSFGEIDKKIQALKESNMTQTEADADRIAKLRKHYDEDLAAFQGTEAEKMALSLKANEHIAAEQQALVNKTPLAAEMKNWGDLTKNLQQQTATMMNSSVDSLTTYIMTGKSQWRSLADGMIKDMLQMGLKTGMSGLMNGSGLTSLLGGGGSKAGAAAGGGGTKGAGAPMTLSGAAGGGGSKASSGGIMGMFAGVHHAGGMVGAGEGPSRYVAFSHFATAPRFHTGGITGDEVPIIAQKGEGVFTKGQMAAIGKGMGTSKGHTFNFSSNVNVNANGGDPSQNADLARQVGAHVENVTRATVVDELMRQMRPGNMLSTDAANIFGGR